MIQELRDAIDIGTVGVSLGFRLARKTAEEQRALLVEAKRATAFVDKLEQPTDLELLKALLDRFALDYKVHGPSTMFMLRGRSVLAYEARIECSLGNFFFEKDGKFHSIMEEMK